MKSKKIYALYDRDRNLCDGTLREIANARHLKMNSVYWILRNTIERKPGRMRLIEILEDEQ